MQGGNLLAYFFGVLRAAPGVVFANCWAHRQSKDTLFCSFVRLLRRLRRFMCPYLSPKNFSVVF